MNPDSVIIAWVESEFGIKWDDLSVEEREDFKRRYNEQHPVLQVAPPTLHEEVLALLNRALEADFARGTAPGAIRLAINLIRVSDAIEQYAEGGYIKVVESGRDCDGVQYDGLVRIIEASRAVFEKLQDEIAESADGPFRLTIVPMSDDPEYETRDLVMEAHENGHAHSIVSRFA